MDLRGEDDMIVYLAKSIEEQNAAGTWHASAELFHHIVRGPMSILGKFYV